MTPEQIAHVDERFDALSKEVGNLRVSVEHRVTKLEERVGIIGILAGLLGGLISGIKFR